MKNEKPGWWWDIWYKPWEVQKSITWRDEKIADFDRLFKWERYTTAKKIENIIDKSNKK